MVSSGGFQLGLRSRRNFCSHHVLKIGIEALLRIEFGAVTGQIKKFRYSRCAGAERQSQIGTQQVDSRSRLVRVPPPTGLQAGVERRVSHRRAAAEHEPGVSMLRPCVDRQPPDTSPVRVCGMRIRGKRRCGRRDQCSQGGTRPLRL